MPDVVLLTEDGLHTPAIPFRDVPGKAGTVPPEHMESDVPKLNVGVMLGLTVTVKVALVAHGPAAGVKI